MSKKRLKLSDQLRKAIETAPMTRYRLSKLTGVDQGLLGKFVRGERAGLRLDTVDAICETLRLRLVAEEPKSKGGVGYGGRLSENRYKATPGRCRDPH